MTRSTLTPDEIAAVLRVSGDTIRRLVRSGELAKVPGFSKIRIRRDVADAYFGPITDEMIDAALDTLNERGAVA